MCFCSPSVFLCDGCGSNQPRVAFTKFNFENSKIEIEIEIDIEHFGTAREGTKQDFGQREDCNRLVY